jgi:hypothetical protein
MDKFERENIKEMMKFTDLLIVNNKMKPNITNELKKISAETEIGTKILVKFDEFGNVKKKFEKFKNKYNNFSINTINDLQTIEKKIMKLLSIVNEEKNKLVMNIDLDPFGDYVRLDLNMGEIVRNVMFNIEKIYFSDEISKIDEQIKNYKSGLKINIPVAPIYYLQKLISEKNK